MFECHLEVKSAFHLCWFLKRTLLKTGEKLKRKGFQINGFSLFWDLHSINKRGNVKGQLNKKILLAILIEKGLKCRNVKKVSFFHLPFQRYWEFYSAPPCFTTAFLVGWALATLTSCREPCARPTRKILASLAVKGLFTGSVH